MKAEVKAVVGNCAASFLPKIAAKVCPIFFHLPSCDSSHPSWPSVSTKILPWCTIKLAPLSNQGESSSNYLEKSLAVITINTEQFTSLYRK
jgi:hypothetical protein